MQKWGQEPLKRIGYKLEMQIQKSEQGMEKFKVKIREKKSTFRSQNKE